MKKRDFNPIDVLLAAEKGRVRELLPLRHERMRKSSFAFFRGTVAIMAADFSLLPHSGIFVQLCGDAHVLNLGSFASPDGSLVFDINDFDETIRGPWEWDVRRMATSIVLAGRESKHTPDDCHSAARNFIDKYISMMREFSAMPVLDIARHRVHRQNKSGPVHAALLQSRRARPSDLQKQHVKFDKKGRPEFQNDLPEFRRVTGKEKTRVLDALPKYRRSLPPERRHFFDLFHNVDEVAFKVVGIGSVGMRDYIVMFQGNGPGDPLFLQIKEEKLSAWQAFLPGESHVSGNQGKRVVEGQRAMQPMSDLLLGWTRIDGRDYLVRQLNDRKGRVDPKKLRGGGLSQLALVAGELLGRGHARSGDARQIASNCGQDSKLPKALADFAVAYADQAEADYRVFLKAIPKQK